MLRKIAATLMFILVSAGPAFGAKTVFIDGVPSTGVKGTKVTAAFLNASNDHYHSGLDVDGAGALPYSAATGTNDLVLTLDPALTAYIPGMSINLKSAATNTGAVTLAINGMAATPVKKNSSAALAAGDIQSGQIFSVAYDGTNFQLLTPQGSPPTIERINYAAFTALKSAADAGTFYTVGPTASGADVIFAQMDSIPAGARYVVLIASVSATAGTTWATMNYNDGSNYRFGYLNAFATAIDSGQFFVPLDSSRKFKIYYDADDAGAFFNAQVIGYLN